MILNNHRQPILIFSLDICLITQSDPGSENFGVANGHSFIRHALDPSLAGSIQHRWQREKKNIPPEIFWSGFHARFAPGYENILEAPLHHLEIRYDPSVPLQ